MNTVLKKLSPYLLIILGILLLFMNQPIPSGVCCLIGVVMIIESIWPEKWGADE